MFILECEGIIYGTGTTEAAALADAREYVEIDASRVYSVAHRRQYYPAGAVAIWPATERLVAAVLRDSHGLRWNWDYTVGAADLARD